ncbi:hypothetical protein [Desulfoluna sp.]|uniref:hypothetical protein n=1 Tax=Desulfoluna sp. TaxID=2045199 RepID=UPI0026178942|nr:hypothetical protein [Desulfoluna sp.]
MTLRTCITQLALIFLPALLLAGCAGVPSEDRVLFDFEQDAELDRLHWKCGTLYSLSTDHPTRGERCLKMELYPSAYPGFFPKLSVSDWRGYTALAMDIYNPSPHAVVLTLRVDDEKKTSYAQRYNGRVVAEPGRTAFVLPFESLTTSGDRRPLNLKRVWTFLLFSSPPEEKQVLYLDAVRLVAGETQEGA